MALSNAVRNVDSNSMNYNVDLNWSLSDVQKTIGMKPNGLKVFTCFHCGGGSTMGYKLAGYNVIGGVEIDKQMMEVYRQNFHPSEALSFLMPIDKLCSDDSLLSRIPALDILDGSPPCSTFSLAGVREEKWGKEFAFREGQATQILDDLFFQFIKLADKLKPKVVIAENVKGIIIGNAKGYVITIKEALQKAGYKCQIFLLNAATMGVPQTRERVFVFGIRNDIFYRELSLDFNEKPITIKDAVEGLPACAYKELTKNANFLWQKTKPGELFNKANLKYYNSGNWFTHRRAHPQRPSATLIADGGLYHWAEPRLLNHLELTRCQTFPKDYNFMDMDPVYIIGMSVPPFMMQRIAIEILRQVFNIVPECAMLG
jgi:DNA (cytosine-5)-methyltransferase 1